jgi:hypothetical protein
MSSFALVLVLVLLLTLLGSLSLLFVTVKYYWGERGTPPVRGEERRRQKQAELKLRAAQIEYLKAHPREERSPSFLDNSKRSSRPAASVRPIEKH